MKTSRLALVLCLFGCPALEAADFSGRHLDPMIRVRATENVPASSVASAAQNDLDFYVTRGGVTTIVRVFRFFEPGKVRVLHQLARGTGSPADLEELKQALVTGRAGARQSCIIEDTEPLATWEVTWYGRNGRRSSFVVAVGPAAATGLPPCGPEAFPLISALLAYEGRVLGNPATELLTNE